MIYNITDNDSISNTLNICKPGDTIQLKPGIYKEKIEIMYNNIYQNKPFSDFIYTFFNDKKMIKTFPNLKIEEDDKNIIYLDTLVGDIVPYFYKFNTKMNT